MQFLLDQLDSHFQPMALKRGRDSEVSSLFEKATGAENIKSTAQRGIDTLIAYFDDKVCVRDDAIFYRALYTPPTKGQNGNLLKAASLQRETFNYELFQALPANVWNAAFPNRAEALTKVADNLFGEKLSSIEAEKAFIGAMFVEQIFGRTRVLSGQETRTTFLRALDELLCQHLVNKDVYFKATYRVKSKPPYTNPELLEKIKKQGAMIVKQYTDKASIWPPSVIVEMLQQNISVPVQEESLHLGALAGSWLSPVVAAQMLHTTGRHKVGSFLLVDVIDEIKRTYEENLQSSMGFEVNFKLDGSETPFDKSEHRKYDGLMWNPPYWLLEMYDIDAETYEQSTAQSTANQDSYTKWLETFVKQTAKNAALLLKSGGRLMCVVPQVIRFHNSFAPKARSKKGGRRKFVLQVLNNDEDRQYRTVRGALLEYAFAVPFRDAVLQATQGSLQLVSFQTQRLQTQGAGNEEKEIIFRRL